MIRDHLLPACSRLLETATALFANRTLRLARRDHPLPLALQTVVESIADGVLMLDQERQIVDINPTARRLLPASERDPVGVPLPLAWPALAAAIDGRAAAPFEFSPAAQPDRIYEITAVPLHDTVDLPNGRLILLHDVTERRAREQWRQEMTQAMVHDLRAPISNTLVALQMLQGDLAETASPDDAMLLDMTFTNTEKTLRMVNQILDVHQLESGEMSLDLAAVSLAPLARSVLDAQTARAAEKEIALVCDVRDDLPAAWADPELLGRILQNLVDNAIKFSPEGATVRISARLRNTAVTDVQQLLISVHDDGPGIRPELQETLFRRHVTGGGNGTGHGLGLTFCRMALAAHGERIWVDSRPGQGATFSFTLSAIA